MATMPLFNGTVYAFAQDGDTVYAGGTFTTVNGVAGYTGLAKFNLVTGVADTSWKPSAGNQIRAMVISPDKTFVIVGNTGNGGSNYLRKYLVNSTAQQTFVTYGGNFLTGMLIEGNYFYIYGGMTSLTDQQGTVTIAGLGKVDITGNDGKGSIVSGFSGAGFNPGGSPSAVAMDANYLYIVGGMSRWQTVTVNGIAKVNKTTGILASGDDSFVGGEAFKASGNSNPSAPLDIMVGTNGSLYVALGGTQLQYKNVGVGNIVKIDKYGARDTNFTSFSGGSYTTTVNRIVEYNSALYVGTAYTTASAATSTGVLKSTNLTTFTRDPAFLTSTGFGTTGTNGRVFVVGSNLFLTSSASTAYKGSAAGFSWAISTATAEETALIPSDIIAPTVALSSPVTNGSTTATNPIAMTATFSESVTGFVSGDLSLVNCTASSFSGSGTTYTFNLIPSGQGAMSVTVPAGAAADPAGNTNTASAAYSFTYDSVSPTTILTSSTVANAGSTNSSAVLMSATFSESVTGLVVGALSLTNCTVASISGSGSSYSFTVVPSGQGAVSVILPAGSAADAAGNSNLVSNTYSFTYDTVSPTVAVTSPDVAYSANSVAASVSMSFTFSESVTGFSASTLSLTNCSVSSFSGSGSSYSAVITPTAPGLVQVTVTTARDAAGNFLVGPGQLFSYFKVVPAIVSQTSVARNQLLDMALSTPALVSVSAVPLIQWKRVLAVYTSPGKKTVVASFKFAVGVAAPGRFLARIAGPASYLLSKMIIIKIGGQGVVIQRADFPTVSGMDIDVT
jgi:hypothetical protein